MAEIVDDRPASAGPTATLSESSVGLAWMRLLRPRQWIKNFFVLAPLLFSGQAMQREFQVRALAAFAVFCLLASGVYAFNDVMDRTSDRSHPVKRLRPVASGAVTASGALTLSVVLLLGSVIGAFTLGAQVGWVALAYLSINILYGLALKRMVIVDVFAVASFFVLRLLAGAGAVGVHPSVWLLLCGGLLALFLGFAKRRHELELLGADSAGHRAVLSQYTTAFLDQLSVVLLSVTVVCYIMYTLESETARLVGTEALSYSAVFVLYGVLRYMFLVHNRKGGDPAETLLGDRPLQAAVILWAAYCAFVVYR